MIDVWSRVSQLPGLRSSYCRIPHDLDSVTTRGHEVPPEVVGCSAAEIDALWERAETLYRSGTQPAIQLCVRREGHVVLNRAIGHASGNAPMEPEDAPKRPVDLDTPINIFSASKAITAMVVHKLDEQGVLRLDDWVCDYIPEFARHGKDKITLRHVLAHRAGLPNLPPEAIDLDLLGHPHRVLELLCDAELRSRPGRLLAYHAVTGGFILGEVVERASGSTIRELLRSMIAKPLGARWMNYGIEDPSLRPLAAENAYTGPPPIPPVTHLLRRALGADIREVVELSNDPRFIEGVIPAANVFTTAYELAAFYQCLLEEGEFEGRRIFQPRTVRHATAEQSYWEIDFTLMAPLRYGLGFMLGTSGPGPFGTDNPRAFGHVGLSNVFSWADPDRQLAVALVTTGKALLSPHVVPLFGLIAAIGRLFPRTAESA